MAELRIPLQAVAEIRRALPAPAADCLVEALEGLAGDPGPRLGPGTLRARMALEQLAGMLREDLPRPGVSALVDPPEVVSSSSPGGAGRSPAADPSLTSPSPAAQLEERVHQERTLLTTGYPEPWL